MEVFDIDRDARTFNGEMPVVCHPPCRAWSAYCSHQAKPLPGEKDLGPYCVERLKEVGGVLEHPAHSRLWKYMNLPKPGQSPINGLWSIEVQQAWWGDCRSKKTWLLFCGVGSVLVPMLPHDSHKDRDRWNKMSKTKRSATPRKFAEWLIQVARRSTVDK